MIEIRLFFSFLSAAYIIGLFIFADSPMVRSLSPFNPYSLLHIPLYGVLTILIIFSFVPITLRPNQTKQKDQTNRFLFAGLIALGVAIADEIY